MSLSKVTFSLCTLANATTLVSAPTITTVTILLTIDFITALLAFWVDSVLLIALSATKHHSQLPYNKNSYSINPASQLSLTLHILGRAASSLVQPLGIVTQPRRESS